MPLSLIIILLLLAIIFYRSKPSFSFKCLCASTLLLFLSSFAPFADWIMAPLESSYPSFSQSQKPVDYIVILGCGHTSDDRLPATSQLYACSLERLVEAIRIFRLHPEATLITSGFNGADPSSNATKVKEAAISLGIPESKIITENFPKDTEEEAQLIAPRIQNTHSVLITNADHMPRAIEYFQKYGANPIAAPASHWVKGNFQAKSWGYYVPNGRKLQQTTYAWYETLGLTVQLIKSLFE